MQEAGLGGDNVLLLDAVYVCGLGDTRAEGVRAGLH